MQHFYGIFHVTWNGTRMGMGRRVRQTRENNNNTFAFVSLKCMQTYGDVKVNHVRTWSRALWEKNGSKNTSSSDSRHDFAEIYLFSSSKNSVVFSIFHVERVACVTFVVRRFSSTYDIALSTLCVRESERDNNAPLISIFLREYFISLH